MPQRSFFAQLPIASAFPRWERAWPSPGILPFALFGQLRSAPELTRTAFDCRFLSRMPYRKLRAPRRCHEVPWQVDLVPSLTDEPLSLDWALISPSGPDRISILAVLGSDRSWLGRLVRTKGPKIIATPAVTGVRSCLRPGCPHQNPNLASLGKIRRRTATRNDQF
jgi:hypothetical protein